MFTTNTVFTKILLNNEHNSFQIFVHKIPKTSHTESYIAKLSSHTTKPELDFKVKFTYLKY